MHAEDGGGASGFETQQLHVSASVMKSAIRRTVGLETAWFETWSKLASRTLSAWTKCIAIRSRMYYVRQYSSRCIAAVQLRTEVAVVPANASADT